MKKKLTDMIANTKNKYEWKYCSLGGITRVTITSGEDIAHLAELDQKMWTVLSCPVKGLELDERTLDLIDYDRDGKIRVDEVVQASQWLCRVIKNPDNILLGHDFIALEDFNTEDEEGLRLQEFAKQVLKIMGLNKDTISLPELDEFLAHYDDDCQKEMEETMSALTVTTLPYGENSDAAVEAVTAIRDKVADYFMRCKFVQFHDDCTQALDVSVEKVAEISEKNLATCVDEISKYPLSRPIANCVLPINEGINPAWQGAFSAVKTLVLDVDFPGKESINEEEWSSVVAKIDAYVATKADQVKAETDSHDEKVKGEHEAIEPLERLLHLYRDFYSLLRNYLFMADFYDKNNFAIFQAGKLYIDSRCCNLCMRVDDMSKHTNMAKLSGMFLIYCTCTSKVLNKTMNIVAAMTDGDLDNLRVGKNAIFYDRAGQDWDAVVTQIIDNPISVRQAFWMPYKKFWNWITEKLNKSAAEKEEKAFAKMTEKADSASSSIAVQANAAQGGQATPKKQAFDIAKFAGIFAAIGMAVGFIGSFLTNVGKALFSSPVAFVMIIAIVLLSISGPSMFIAWSKLRKRNLGPVLNANGWAINAKIPVNVRFGATLTEMADYPRIVLDDPYAEKKMPKWLRRLITLLIILVVAFVLLYFKGYFNRYDNMKALHYDESSIVYRTTDKLFGSMKEELANATESLNEALTMPPADSTAVAAPATAPAQ